MSVAVLGGVLLTWRAAGRERRLARIRNAFVANVSHELRTPIASLAVFGEFMRRGRVGEPEKVVEYGRRIEHESDRLRHLIDNVLDFARIESVGTRYRPEEALIEDVVGAAINAVDARRERDGFTISVSWPDTLLPIVQIDAQAMTQVFVNLLDNAMKYSGRSRRVQVDVFRCEDHVAVRVGDSESASRRMTTSGSFSSSTGRRRRSTTACTVPASALPLCGTWCFSMAAASRWTVVLGAGRALRSGSLSRSAASRPPRDASNAVKSVRISAGAEA